MSEQPKREHKSGKSTGYETDGVHYWLAPTLVNRWGEIQDQELALNALMDATIRTLAEVRRQTERQKRSWWDSVYDDLGLDKSFAYSFNRLEGKLVPPPARKDE